MINARIEDNSSLYARRKRVREGQRYYTESLRPPTTQETATYFHISMSTISKWWQDRDQILNSKGSSRIYAAGNRRHEQYPELEMRLFEDFQHARDEHKRIGQYWFKRRAAAIFLEAYPNKKDKDGNVSLKPKLILITS